MRIGIDFDNTIAGYDRVFRAAAADMGMISEDFTGGKREIRDAIRLLDDGENKWQRLQGRVYGKLMAEADLIDGVGRFLETCRDRGAIVFVVSHKTEYANHDPDRVNLRRAAQRWMQDRGFFDSGGFAISPANVHFEATRADKLRRIRALACTHFVDDLEEVLGDDDFPAGVRRILFGRADAGPGAPYETFADWGSIRKALFDA